MTAIPASIGGSRFDVRRRLGAGGFGIVYEAFDRERAAEVAVKALARVDAAALYRFKREFRSLADVRHPNLVELFELVADADEWFLVMELVRGRDCLAWIRGERPALDPAKESPTHDAPQPRIRTGEHPTVAKPAVDYARLRDVLVQVGDGLVALHAAGKLHRDVKPSNVLVEERTGRVVIVDFGISTELRDRPARTSDAGTLPGTPEYMAPEQATGDALSEAADWYAVGVLLFEALTGRLPFVGAPLQILLDKQRYEAPRPSEIVAGVPQDLDALCVDLLRVRPDARPKGAEILRRLGAPLEPSSGLRAGARGQAPPSRTTRAERAILVGRDDELAALAAAYERARLGRATTVLVSGRSGMGKTALVRAFLERLDGDAIVLAGRCYEREQVPYKALDAVIDELSRALLRLPENEAAAVVPRDAAALVRLFPVLQRVGAIAEAPRRPLGTSDPLQLRRRGFGALRELLARLADRRPLVVFIDDLQWGDVDSAALLEELASPPDAPSFLLVVSYRSEDVAASPPLRILARSGVSEVADLVRIHVDPLDREQVRGLAATLLGPDAPASLLDGIADESKGTPLLVREVVDSVQSEASAFSSQFRLETILRNRLLSLPGAARRLLEVLAVAGRPLRLDRAMQAAGLAGDARREALDYLRVARLVRAQGSRGSDTAEPWHDRVREAVLAQLDASTLRETHGAIARALRGAGDADPEALFTHFDAAGAPALAAQYAEEAAAKAARALAFERAAQFYRHALDRSGDEGDRAPQLRELLADALANAGRGAEAAEAFLAAAARQTGLAKLELQRRAAEQLLVSGHVDRGIEVTRAVLGQLGLDLARTPRQALVAFLLLRLWIWVRGLRFEERDPATVPPKTLARIDVSWSTSAGLAVVDNIRAVHFGTRNLLQCLRAGEPTRLLRALVLESIFVATRGARAYPKAQSIVDVCRGLARRHPSGEADALVELAIASTAFFTGHWRLGSEAADRFFAHYREGLPRLQWELRSVQYFGLCALIYRGELDVLAERFPAYLREAQDRGDLYFGTNLYVGETNLWWLIANEPAEARRVVHEAMDRWSKGSVQVQHWYALQSLAQIDLYTGDLGDTLARIERELPRVRASFLLRVQHTRVRARWLRARVAIATASPGGADKASRACLAKAARDARALEREGAPWADALARLIRAGIAARRGDRDGARVLLNDAIARLEAADMKLHAHAARHRLATLSGGEDPAAVRWLREHGVKSPGRLAATLVPGVD